MSDRELFFHVGLGRTASTYLQKLVFPDLQGVTYIPPKDYKRRAWLLPRYTQGKVLISRELDRQLETEVASMLKLDSRARIIIVLRRQDDWLASQYRRYVKNGWYHDFQNFLDLDEDHGFWKQKDLHYRPKIEWLDGITSRKPLVLLYHDLLRDPQVFVNRITDYLGMEERVNAPERFVHRSFSDRQLLFLRRFYSGYIRRTPKGYSNPFFHWTLYRPVWAFNHLMLYLGKFQKGPTEPLIQADALLRIREHYANDWKWVQSRATSA